MSDYSIRSVFKNRLVLGSAILFILLSLLTIWARSWKVFSISWIACIAMIAVIPWGIHHAQNHARSGHLITAYGLCSGAMITSAAVFLAPVAINHGSIYGGFGIALGMLSGFAIHTFNHDLDAVTEQVTPEILELILHTLTAGLVIGMIYAEMPSLSLLLGLAIISHKAPAGYVAARQLESEQKSPWITILPACGVGITALPVSLININGSAGVQALIFGFATGIFLHMASDFLPVCNAHSPLHNQIHNEGEGKSFDSFRSRAIFSTFGGGVIVFVLWLIIH